MIFDAGDQIGLVKQALEAEGLSESAYPAAHGAGARSRRQEPPARRRGLRVAAPGTSSRSGWRGVYRRYQGICCGRPRRSTSTTASCSRSGCSPPSRGAPRASAGASRYLLVDEYQDTNHAQLRLVRELVGAAGNLTAVGDEDQGIYRWRGADLDNILHVRDAASPAPRCASSSATTARRRPSSTPPATLVAHNTNAARQAAVDRRRARRADRALQARATRWTRRAGWSTTLPATCAAPACRWRDIAVLVRTNAQTRALEEELLRTRDRPTRWSAACASTSAPRSRTWSPTCACCAIRATSFSLARILNQPPRGIGKATQRAARGGGRARRHPLWDVLVARPAREPAAEERRGAARVPRPDRRAPRRSRALPLPALLDQLLERTGLLRHYQADDPEAQARLENIQEFLSAAQELLARDPANQTRPARESLPDAPRSHRAGRRPRRLGGRARRRADDAAQRQGAGVPARWWSPASRRACCRTSTRRSAPRTSRRSGGCSTSA